MIKTSARALALLSLLFVHPAVAAAAPGAATPIAPSGEVTGTTIAFSWQSEPTSTWYLFWLGKGTPTALVMQTWYTAEQAGCAGGGTCTITVTPPVNAGGHVWFVQTWNASGTGPWSAAMVFSVKDPVQNWSGTLPNARRFTLAIGSEGVLDNETGLVWERTPSNAMLTLAFAQLQCLTTTRGSRKGWRVPTFAEIATLTDGAYALPAGHPFTGISGAFWTQTAVIDSTNRYVMQFDGGPATASPGASARVWCVRAPSTPVY